MIEFVHLYISSGHNFFGHHGKAPSAHPMIEVTEVECIAGNGLVGDRFFGHKENYKGQITFFQQEVFEELSAALGIHDREPAVFRRNVITRGVDLNSLIGRRFEAQGVLFEGTEECSPCYWMEGAFGPGALEGLRRRGGLRARILSSGKLTVTGPAGTALRVIEKAR